MAMVDAVIAESEAISYCPTRAEALSVKAYCLPDYDPVAISLNEQSFFSAEECGHERAAAMASAALVYEEAQRNPTNAEQWGRICRAKLNRMGGDRQIEGWLLNNLGALRIWQDRFEAARELLSKAIEVKTSWLGSDNPDVAISEGNLAIAIFRTGKYEKALELSRRARAKHERWSGADGIEVALDSNNEGEILLEFGRTVLAQGALTNALRIFNERAIEDDRIAAPLTGLGKVALNTGDRRKARTLLERALEIRIKQGGVAIDVADTRFALARALDSGWRDRERACRLAKASLATYEAHPAFAKERKEIEAWLTEASCRRSEGRRGGMNANERPGQSG